MNKFWRKLLKTQENVQAPEPDFSDSVEYARRVLAFNFGWYKNADTKAQIILSLDGIFLAFVTTSIFIDQKKLLEILDEFSPRTWTLVGLMAFCLTVSIISSMVCLWSRIPIIQKRFKEKYLSENNIDFCDVKTYKAEATLFFINISCLNRERYRELMKLTNKEFEISALASDIHILSENVSQKHKFVNFGFLFAGTSLLCFLAFGISYLIDIVLII